jgi:hypothetical protein
MNVALGSRHPRHSLLSLLTLLLAPCFVREASLP